MDIAISVELSDDGGRLLFRNRATRSLLFSFDVDKKASAQRLVAQAGVLARHFDELAKRDTQTMDMFATEPMKGARRVLEDAPVASLTRQGSDDALWTHEWREEKKEATNE